MTQDLEQQDTEAGVVADLAREAGQPREIGEHTNVVSVLVPDGAHHETIDLERYDLTPWRKRGTVILHEPVSFADYVMSYSSPATNLYADVRKSVITAVLNDHQEEGDDTGGPGWGDHRAVLHLRHSHEWKTWTDGDGQMVDQVTFAEFIEHNYPDIISPDHATMLEIAQSIEATSSGEFESKHRLDDGQVALRYTQNVEARAGTKGDLTIPQTFTIALRCYEGTEPVSLTARFRYRIGNGQLRIGYKLERLDDVRDAAFADVVAAVEQRIGRELLRGAAPDPVTAGR